MKKLNKIVSLAMSIMMIAALCAAFTMSASAEAPEVGDVFAPKTLGANVATDGVFTLAALDGNGAKVDLVYDAANTQFTANGKRVFRTNKIEHGSVYPHASVTDYNYLYARPNDGYKAVIIFKAPAAGTYDFDVLLCKPYYQYGGAGADTGCKATVSVLKNGTGTALMSATSEEVIDSATNLPQAIVNQDFEFKKSLELAEGDEIWFVIGADANYSNQMNIIKLNATYSAAPSPVVPTPTPTPTPTPNPDTADGIIISVMVAIASACAAIVISKK